MNISEDDVFILLCGMTNAERHCVGQSLLTQKEVSDMHCRFLNNHSYRLMECNRVRGIAVGLAKHLGLREPRDERIVQIPMFPKSRRSDPPADIPRWVLEQAGEIARYMGERHLGVWKIDGIQKRVD